MTVADLIKELKKLPKGSEVFMVKDWEDVEDGCLNDLYRLIGVSAQVRIVEDAWTGQTRLRLYLNLRTKKQRV